MSDRFTTKLLPQLSRRHMLAGLAAGALTSGASLPWTTNASAQGAPAADAITVTLLGTGTPSPRPDRFGPSTLVEAGGKKLLIDAGRGLTIRLNQIKVPLGQIDGLFITHFHSDHVNGLSDFWLTGYLPVPYGARKTPLRLIGPTGMKRIADTMRTTYEDDIKIRMADENVPELATQIDTREFSGDSVVFDEGGIKVTAFVVNHGDLIKPNYAFRIDYAGRSVVLSGDTKFDENLIKHSMGADLLVHEVCMLPEALKNVPAFKAVMDHHTSPEEVGTVFTRTKARLAAFTHLVKLGTAQHPPVSDDAIVEGTRKTYSGPLVVGQDLTRFVVGAEIKTLVWDAQRGAYPS